MKCRVRVQCPYPPCERLYRASVELAPQNVVTPVLTVCPTCGRNAEVEVTLKATVRRTA